jgi:hypothetical protein
MGIPSLKRFCLRNFLVFRALKLRAIKPAEVTPLAEQFEMTTTPYANIRSIDTKVSIAIDDGDEADLAFLDSFERETQK